jgi:hypothetical protein
VKSQSLHKESFSYIFFTYSPRNNSRDSSIVGRTCPYIQYDNFGYYDKIQWTENKLIRSPGTQDYLHLMSLISEVQERSAACISDVCGVHPRRSPPGGYSARVKGRSMTENPRTARPTLESRDYEGVPWGDEEEDMAV